MGARYRCGHHAERGSNLRASWKLDWVHIADRDPREAGHKSGHQALSGATPCSRRLKLAADLRPIADAGLGWDVAPWPPAVLRRVVHSADWDDCGPVDVRTESR